MHKKLLYQIGFFATLLGSLGSLWLFIEYISLIKLVGWDELLPEFHLSFMSVLFIPALALWIKISQKWKKWALGKVKDKDKEWLLMKITHKDSFVANPWHQWSKKNRRFTIVGLFVFSALIIGIDIYKTAEAKEFNSRKKVAEGEVKLLRKHAKNKSISRKAEYSFVVDNTIFSGETQMSKGYFSNYAYKGISVEIGDMYLVEYDRFDPSKSKLILSQPIGHTLEKIKTRIKEELSYTYEEESLCSCIMDSVYADVGYKGLSILYNSRTSYWENRALNKVKYYYFSKTDNFQRIERNCRQRTQIE